jgi:hypothetical protein
VSPKVGGPGAEVTDQPVVFVPGQEVRDGFSDLGIWKFFGNILGVSMQGKKMVKLPESPYPGFPHMDGRMIELSREGYQVQVFDILYGLKLTGAGGLRSPQDVSTPKTPRKTGKAWSPSQRSMLHP